MPIVKVLVLDDNPGTTEIVGANVYFYSTIGVLQTSAVTDSDGIATVTLPAGTYDLYVFKIGYSTVQPQLVVVDAILENSFQVNGHLKKLPEPQDPTLCRVSGNVITFSGTPAKSFELTFTQDPKNIIVGKRQVFNRPIMVKSDNKGYFEFDLLRKVKYKADVQNYFGNEEIIVKTPDRPAVYVSDLLFPIPLSIDLSRATLALSVGGAVDTSVTYTVHYSDGNTDLVGHEWYNLIITSSNPSVVEVGGSFGRLAISPIGVGTATISFTRRFPDEYLWLDTAAFESDTLVVTVT